MDYGLLILGIPFIISNSAINIYCFITKKQFIKRRYNTMIQGSFWLVLGGYSIYNFLNSLLTYSLIANAVLAIAGLVFGSYFFYKAIKDKTAYLLPYALEGNQPSMEKYSNSIGASKLELFVGRPSTINAMLFSDMSDDEKLKIMNDISNNREIVAIFGSPASRRKLSNNLIFSIMIIIIIFFIL